MIHSRRAFLGLLAAAPVALPAVAKAAVTSASDPLRWTLIDGSEWSFVNSSIRSATIEPLTLSVDTTDYDEFLERLNNSPSPNDALKSLLENETMTDGGMYGQLSQERALTWQGHDAGERGDWMQTVTGRAFYPLDPRPEEIHIEDIAAALSKLCRFGGHTKRFYSVAEHCVLMSRVASPGVAFEALMHDASEAYLCDVIRPIKPSLTNYRAIEMTLEQAISKRFDLVYPMPAEVKRLDNAILADERDQAMAVPPQDWRLPEPPLGVTLQFWSPEKAEFEFLAAFRRLCG